MLECLSVLYIYFVFTMVLYQIEAFPFSKKFELGGKAQWYYASNVVPDSLTRECSGCSSFEEKSVRLGPNAPQPSYPLSRSIQVANLYLVARILAVSENEDASTPSFSVGDLTFIKTVSVIQQLRTDTTDPVLLYSFPSKSEGTTIEHLYRI